MMQCRKHAVMGVLFVVALFACFAVVGCFDRSPLEPPDGPQAASVIPQSSSNFESSPRLEAFPVPRGPVSCEPPVVVAEGGRYLAVTPQPAGSTTPVAILVQSPDYPGFCKYVNAGGRLVSAPQFQAPTAWATVHAGDQDIVPSTAYTFKADCGGGVFSAETSATTWAWGDANNSAVVDVDDIVCVLDAFIGFFFNCTLYGVDLAAFPPNETIIDVDDIVAVLNAFVGNAYPGLPPAMWGHTPILDPHDTMTNAAGITITGTADGASVEVSGPAGASLVPVVDDAFTAKVPLEPDTINQLYFTAISACGIRSAPAATAITQDDQAPSLFIDFPPDGAELTLAATDVAGRVGDMLSGFMGLTVTVNGQPCVVDVGIGNNGTFLCQDVPLNVGPNPIIATATDSLTNSMMKSITVTRIALCTDCPRMEVVSGNAQLCSGQPCPIHEVLPQPIVVRVLKGDGSPFVNKVVTFDVIRSDGRLTGDAAANCSGDGTMMLQCHTDSNGLVRAFWQLGGDAGCGNNRIEVKSTSIAGTTFFCASANPGAVAQINVGSGNNQRAEAGGPAPEPLKAWVSDTCNGVPGVQVTFTVTRGGGKVNGQDSVIVDTGDTGHAQVNFTLGPQGGNNVVEATYPGNPGSPATFVLFGVVRDEFQPTSFSGIVLNNAQQPIVGAACTLYVGWVEVGQTVTDPSGQFRFDDLSVSGAAHLDVDGGTVLPVGSYPALAYDMVLIPNAVNALPAPVLLPPLDPCNAVLYDGTQDVTLVVRTTDPSDPYRCVPTVQGLKMTVKAGSMRRVDGSTPSPSDPAILSVNQVHHDDVPMPIPDGAAPPFAWTLQPSGATFDPPVSIEYPNMSGLPAGSIAYFLSFNHDTNRFEIVGSGHVVDDGSTIVTDPGAGLSIAGWGCNCPPYSVTGDCCDAACCGSTDACCGCPNDSFCDGMEICANNACQPGLPPCPNSRCDELTQTCVECLTDGDCDDNLICNGVEWCQSNLCVAGKPQCAPELNCNEGADPNHRCGACLSDHDCTGVNCDGYDYCIYGICVPSEQSNRCGPCQVHADCDDGVSCNGQERCLGGHCKVYEDLDCIHYGPLVGYCDELNDVCVQCFFDWHCDDAVFCNGSERCSAGVCVGGGLPCVPGENCNEGTNACGDCGNDLDCDDGNFCDGPEVCINGHCQIGTEPTCPDDGIACTIEYCNIMSDTCDWGTNSSMCPQDGFFCNGVEYCLATGCGSLPPPCNPSGPNPICDEDNDRCVSCLTDSQCDDGLFCNGGERCLNGHCSGGYNPCVSACFLYPSSGTRCDEETDSCNCECSYHSDCGLPGLGDILCHGPAVCINGQCVAVTPPNCDDGIQCTVDRCTNGECYHNPLALLCDDGLYCNGLESCTVTGCIPGEVPCEPGTCNELKNSCDP